ncbi:CocE/NonD family hydrolase [Testudinibacter sp. P27/CKL/0425]
MKQNLPSKLAPFIFALSMAFGAAADTAKPDLTTLQSVEYPNGKWKLKAAQYGVEIVENVNITMDDGIILNASVAYPTDLTTGKRAAGKFPVVIEHMPYEKFAVAIPVNTFFAEHGYISVLVRARGLGKSEGEVQFLSPREGQDGKNLVEWASQLEHSDGRVALQGCSWPGAIAINDAGYVGKNSALKAVIASCSGMENMARQSWFSGGMPSMSFWLFDALGKEFVGDTPSSSRFFNMMTQSVKSGGDIAYQGNFWKQRGQATLANNIVENNVPIMFNAGWKGVVEMGAVRAYTALQNAYANRSVYAPMNAAQQISPRYQLIMGGWDHGQGLDMGLYLQWLDTWVKGEDTGLQHSKTPMHLFEQGSNRWINLTGYPEINATRWKLGSQGGLTLEQTHGNDTLAYAQPADSNGKISYTTEPFAKGATLSGAISATIYAQSSNSNLILIGHLYDVAPDGSQQLITRGALVGSLRAIDEEKSWKDANGTVTYPWQTFEQDAYLEPNQTYRFDLSMNTRQWGIQPEHRLRFELTSQTPTELCPVEGAPPKNDIEPCRLTATQQQTVPGGTYTLLYGTDTPLSLNLPQLDYQAQPEVRSGKLALPWNEGARRLEIGERQGDNPAIDNLLPMDTSITHPLVW